MGITISPIPGGAILDLIGDVGKRLIDGLFPDKIAQEKERAAAEQTLIQISRTFDLQEIQASLSAILAEAQSADPWTSRARPSFLYIVYIFILWSIPFSLFFIYAPDKADLMATGAQKWLAAIPDQMWWLFGAGYLGYTAGRSFDKWKAGAK